MFKSKTTAESVEMEKAIDEIRNLNIEKLKDLINLENAILEKLG